MQDRDDWGLALGRTDFFSSGWLSEARLQVVRGDQRVHGLDPRCGGPCDAIDQGGPEVTLSGLAVAGRQLNTPQDRANLAVQLAETLTRNWGRHTLKAGFDLDLGGGTPPSRRISGAGTSSRPFPRCRASPRVH